ncbi:hypothetical protein DERP_014773 [Dermatophagoides pteronyssinus]|uniref:Uncharacterized protein n=1 Tax=Dermatophagoides pteronyssinus TaxID=6956 RepID=A0ABQ8J2D7_DERPT|nr:hypothetical protein DERP_014773 [Dermatophagoides pteronyssinus]
MNNNNQQQQQQDTNQNNVSANLNDTDPNISNISDFIITNDPSLHAVSSRQFEQQIGNEDQINRDFNWLDYQTGQSYYDSVAWRSSPVPCNTNAVLIHEYSGNVSYNDILTESDSNSTESSNVSDEYFVLNSLELDMPIQQQQQQRQRQSPPPAPPSSPTQSGDEFIIIDSLEHDDE